MSFAWGVGSMLSALLLATPGQVQAQAAMPSAFGEAMQAYADQHFREAFDGLARLADAGHGDAARIGLLMVAHGPRLFGERFDATPPQRMRWLDAASAAEQHRLASRL